MGQIKWTTGPLAGQAKQYLFYFAHGIMVFKAMWAKQKGRLRTTRRSEIHMRKLSFSQMLFIRALHYWMHYKNTQ